NDEPNAIVSSSPSTSTGRARSIAAPRRAFSPRTRSTTAGQIARTDSSVAAGAPDGVAGACASAIAVPAATGAPPADCSGPGGWAARSPATGSGAGGAAADVFGAGG